MIYKENTKTWTFCWMSLSMSRALSSVFQSNNRGIILNKILPLNPQCTGQAGGQCKLFVLPPQQSRHRGLNPDVLGTSCHQHHSPICWVVFFFAPPGRLALSQLAETALLQQCMVCRGQRKPCQNPNSSVLWLLMYL